MSTTAVSPVDSDVISYYLRVVAAVLGYCGRGVLALNLGLVDHDAPPAGKRQTNCCYLSNIMPLYDVRHLTSVTCLASWYWLSLVSPVSEAAGCRHHRQTPSPEPSPDHFQSPEEEPRADTTTQHRVCKRKCIKNH